MFDYEGNPISTQDIEIANELYDAFWDPKVQVIADCKAKMIILRQKIERLKIK